MPDYDYPSRMPSEHVVACGSHRHVDQVRIWNTKGIPFSIFVYDGALWARGEEAAAKVEAVLPRAKIIDGIMGTEMRVDSLAYRTSAHLALADFIGAKKCVHTFKFLGTCYNTKEA